VEAREPKGGCADRFSTRRSAPAGLQTANPALYQASLAGLSAEQQGVLADVAAKAAEGGDAVVAQREYEALQREDDAE